MKLINPNIEYAIRLASQFTFEFSRFDHTLNVYFDIADKAIKEKNLPAAQLIFGIGKDSVVET